MTAQPSPDLPTRPSHGCQDCNTTCDQRCARPGCTAPTSPDREDVYQAATRAFRERYFVPEVPEALAALDTAMRAAVDEAVRLTEQRLDQSDDHLVAQLTVQLMNARTALAAMTARAESAEAQLAQQAPGWESPAALQAAYDDVLARWQRTEAQLAEVERWCQIADHGQALKSGIAGSVGALGTGDIRKAIREAGQRYDETVAETALSRPRSAQESTVAGEDTNGSEGVSGGAA